MSYRLGVDVGGTFTDLLLINETTGQTHTAKVPSTPQDSSIGVLNGVERIDPQRYRHRLVTPDFIWPALLPAVPLCRRRGPHAGAARRAPS